MQKHEEHLRNATQFINEATNSLSLAEAAVEELSTKAAGLAPVAAKYEATCDKYTTKNAELVALEKKLAEVQGAHAAFLKAATSV